MYFGWQVYYFDAFRSFLHEQQGDRSSGWIRRRVLNKERRAVMAWIEQLKMQGQSPAADGCDEIWTHDSIAFVVTDIPKCSRVGVIAADMTIFRIYIIEIL